MALLTHKKENERRILDQFRRLYTEFPGGRIIASESPDFILRTSTKYSIGIELVSLPVLNQAGSSSFNKIKNCILAKEEKLPLYRKKKLDRYWLLIYTVIPGQITSWDSKRIPYLEVSRSYHRIFILQVAENEIITIK